MKRILVIGAGFLQSFIIKKAKELGYYVISIDKNPNSIGFHYSDEFGVVDIVDQEACLQFAYSKEINGVITAATDYGVLSTAYIAENLGLPGVGYKAAQIIKNKYMVRKILAENRIDDISQFYEIDDINTLHQVAHKMQFPVMVKPCDGSGSKSVSRVDSLEETYEKCENALRTSLTGKALIEDFVEGEEYGAESFVYNGEVHVLGIMKKRMTSPPFYAELGHTIPSNLKIENKVEETIKKAINSLGITFGPVNMDLLISKNNRVYIVDVGARMGGNLIGSHIIPIGTGIDYMSWIIRSAVGDPIDLNSRTDRKIITTRILALTPGIVKKLPAIRKIEQECGVTIYLQLTEGSVIRSYKNNLDGCGYIVSVSDNTTSADSNAEKALRMIDTEIVRV